MRRQLWIVAAIVAACAIFVLAFQVGSDDPSDATATTSAPATTDQTSSTSSRNPPTTQPSSTSASPTTSDAVDAVSISALFDGGGERVASVEGFVVWDVASARLCSVLMESFPPQCGSPWLIVANPEGMSVDLASSNDVRWTDLPVVLDGTFDGGRLILDEQAAVAQPSSADETMVNAFVEFAQAPSDAAATPLPFASEVHLGLGSELVNTVAADQLANPARWKLDVDEYAGFGGPFSALDHAKQPLQITVGAHQPCNGAPRPPPEGLAALRQVSIQPTDIDSCIAWWSVDFFVDDANEIHAVTLDLFGP